MSTLQDCFLSLLERYVHQLTTRGARATGLCPFHPDRHPSFFADIERGVWYCFPCHLGGGVKRFAELVGKPWTSSSLNRQERKQLAVTLRRRDAERQARAILARRTEAHLDALWTDWRDTNTEAAQAAELLALFYRRPDLEVEFSDLAARAEHDYGEAVSRRVLLEAKLDGEVV